MEEREKFLREVIRAYTEGDSKFFMDHITDDICWEIVGERYIGGKSEFQEVLEQMQEMPSMEIDVENIIINDHYGIVEGVVKSRNRLGQKKHFGFCDIYRFKEGTHPAIQNIKSYVIDISRHMQYKEQC
ncbi:nuclear transport factor 2 family protein [Salinimicrobium oceani]|uniref:Nuclear transport factor 2 family protein n=1 Tax=Salinimicrobium oceani TaxID=2722702 RepID=A0ABX1D486_9FLAO|nr:nuclear transport factor 2 family protein [Salinimicrobium oceani]NJW53351.1 nuclear transport factor 2 family protein [Salinimicrobium oceani]